jgi:hypothetical protein
MTATAQMLESYPRDLGREERQRLETAIVACFECGQVCTTCADACLSEPRVADMIACVRASLDCADVCATTGRVLSRHTWSGIQVAHRMLEACVQACLTCAEECNRHSGTHDYCGVCMVSCRTCEEACNDLGAILR